MIIKEKQEEYEVYEFKRNRWELLCDDIETRINKLNTKQNKHLLR